MSSSTRRAGGNTRNPIMIAALLGALLLFWSRSRSAPPSSVGCPAHDKTYGVMFDAGSTGSRVHVYEFSGEKGNLKLEDELFEQLKPGLSGHFKESGEVQKAVNSLIPLLDKAVARVPESQRRCVPIALKATAGLRLLGQEQSNAILAGVRELFKKYPFKLASDNDVSLMKGSDEAIFGWMTVNFLLENLGKEKKQTAAIIDMGGGSTQIVFEPSASALAGAPAGAVTELSYNGRTFKLYEQSHLGYGLMEARKKIAAKGDCKDAASCASTAKAILNKEATCAAAPCSFNGVWQPSLPEFNGAVYAFSYYYDRMETRLPADGTIAVSALSEAAAEECGKAAGDDCTDLSYLHAVVNTGYDLAGSAKLQVKKKIKGIETAWTLGAILRSLD